MKKDPSYLHYHPDKKLFSLKVYIKSNGKYLNQDSKDKNRIKWTDTKKTWELRFSTNKDFKDQEIEIYDSDTKIPIEKYMDIDDAPLLWTLKVFQTYLLLIKNLYENSQESS